MKRFYNINAIVGIIALTVTSGISGTLFFHNIEWIKSHHVLTGIGAATCLVWFLSMIITRLEK